MQYAPTGNYHEAGWGLQLRPSRFTTPEPVDKSSKKDVGIFVFRTIFLML
jgi:hypothetical protein